LEENCCATESTIDKLLTDRTLHAKDFAARCEELHGLTREQLDRMVAAPFRCPDLVEFPDPLEVQPLAPILAIFSMMAERLDGKGVKATATGSLPRGFCQEIARICWGDSVYHQRAQIRAVNREADFDELHLVRRLSETAGLVRNLDGRLILTPKCLRLRDQGGAAAIYPLLFRAYAVDCPWPSSGLEIGSIPIQSAWPFTLYLIHRYGQRRLSSAFYEDCFLRIFPIRTLPDGGYERYYQAGRYRCDYTWFSLKEFADRLGLIELRPYLEPGSQWAHFEIRKTPLLDHVARFLVPVEESRKRATEADEAPLVN